VQLTAQLCNGFRLAGRNHLNLAGVGVAHGTAQTKLGRLAVNKPPEPDALHPAPYEEVNNHDGSVSQSETL
jgi:hypothetical protein